MFIIVIDTTVDNWALSGPPDNIWGLTEALVRVIWLWTSLPPWAVVCCIRQGSLQGFLGSTHAGSHRGEAEAQCRIWDAALTSHVKTFSHFQDGGERPISAGSERGQRVTFSFLLCSSVRTSSSLAHGTFLATGPFYSCFPLYFLLLPLLWF